MHRSPNRRHNGPPRSVRLLLGSLAGFLVASLPTAAQPAAADEPGSTADALGWLDSEIDAAGGFLTAPASNEPDWGLTADVALARISTGDADSDRTRSIASSLLEALGSYSTWDDIGPEYPGVRLAGPLAKVLLVAASAGLDTSDVDGVDLANELAGLMQVTGEQAGRYSDRNEYGPDTSNGFGQAYAMLAASLLGGAPPESIGFLLAQQCPSGGFRLVYDGNAGCETDDESDPDATALAIQVLLVLDRTDAVEAALGRATGQLISIQEADGSFAGAPPADVPNANTTGLAAQALRAAGQQEAADRAGAWVAGQLQLGISAQGTPAAGDIGGIAYDPARRSAALANGLGSSRDQWRRSTPQGLLAFDAGLIVGGVDEPPVEPVVPTTTTTTTTTTSTTVAPVAAEAAAPTSAPPVPGAADATAGADVAGASEGAAPAGAQLAATGTQGETLSAVGLGLILLGAGSVWLAVRTRGRREAWTWRP